MIPFYRKIRKKMADDNKPMKYLRYAIGEIVLVVIGILIALQINNFNNDKKQRDSEQAYLQSLQIEFKRNLIKINDCITENEKQIIAAEKMLTLFDNNIRDTISDSAISGIMHSIFSGQATYKPSMGVLTDIISSGNLNLIQNRQLRQGLASFESHLDFLKVQENGTLSVKDEMTSLLNKNGSIRKVLIDRGLHFERQSISDTVNNKRLFNLIEFENNLLDYYLIIKAANGPRFFGGIKEQIELVLSDIDSELKK